MSEIKNARNKKSTKQKCPKTKMSEIKSSESIKFETGFGHFGVLAIGVSDFIDRDISISDSLVFELLPSHHLN
jgi:hypothetical protein